MYTVHKKKKYVKKTIFGSSVLHVSSVHYIVYSVKSKSCTVWGVIVAAQVQH